MAKLELELQGNYDDILLDIERCLIVDEESSTDTRVGGNRCVVRTYSVGVNLTLMEIGSSIRLFAVNTDDSNTGSAFGLNTNSGEFYLDTIKDAVEKYRVNREENAYISHTAAYQNLDKVINSYSEHTTGSNEDIKQTKDISSRAEFALKEAVTTESKEENKSIHEGRSDKGVKVVCACADNNKDELYKSSYEHSSDTRYNPISYEMSRARYRRRTSGKKLMDKFLLKIAKTMESKAKDTSYDYEMLVRGCSNIVFGVVISGAYLVGVHFLNELIITNAYISLFIFAIAVVFICYGISYIIKPTQMIYRKFMWSWCVDKFVCYQEDTLIVRGILDKTSQDVEKSNEMILYDNHAKFYMSGNIVEWDYKSMECIYETDNMFVVMVQSNYICSFPKCDMSSKTEEKVRAILSPYYRNSSQYSVY